MSETIVADPAGAALGDVLNNPAPMIDEAGAEALVKGHYGIEAKAQTLACERDANFHMTTALGTGFTLKVSNSAEPEISTNFQTEALLWLERADATLPVPKVVRALNGRSELFLPMADGRSSVVRLLTWLDGVPVVRVGVTPRLRSGLGATLARLGKALHGFEHPGSDHEILWDIKHAAKLRPLLDELADAGLRGSLLAELNHFEAVVRPALDDLRCQVVHNDLNHHNALVNPWQPDEISGVLDFGDMVRTPLIIDLAVAASYHTHLEEAALAPVCEIVGAYHRILPLERGEVALLRDLIVARLMTTVAITEWRAARYPANAAYILRNTGPAKTGLARFATLPREEVTQALLAACGLA